MSLREVYKDQALHHAMKPIESFATRWQSPSNIALVKYWGKHGNQLPMNPSISFTLSRCFSDTYMGFDKKTGPSTTVDFKFLFNQSPAPQFEARIRSYLESIIDIHPFLTQYVMDIQSSNSFPHSAGIASSASGYSALALCLASMEDQLFGNLDNDEDFRQKASYLARLGSGSASRSIHSRAGWWGKSAELDGTSDEFAVDCSDLLHPVFDGYQDSIIVVSADEKPVSSSHGHHLMEFHPYKQGRLSQVNQHLAALKSSLQTGDLEHFGQIVEREALSLHALMLSSSPGYFLVTGSTISVIHAIRAFREQEKVPCYFTLDAGPNIHLLYPSKYSNQVRDFIENELDEWTTQVIYDEIGNGPLQLA
jgi:diphosphomevalonate decarboxylase